MKEKPQGPIENLLDGLSQHAQLLSEEDMKAELTGRGIDVEEFLQKAHTTITQYQKADRLAWMKAADEKRTALQARDLHAESWLEKGEAAIRSAFADLLRTTMPQQTIAFRNKTDLTTEDMARILDDHERLKFRSSGPNASEEKR